MWLDELTCVCMCVCVCIGDSYTRRSLFIVGEQGGKFLLRSLQDSNVRHRPSCMRSIRSIRSVFGESGQRAKPLLRVKVRITVKNAGCEESSATAYGLFYSEFDFDSQKWSCPDSRTYLYHGTGGISRGMFFVRHGASNAAVTGAGSQVWIRMCARESHGAKQDQRTGRVTEDLERLESSTGDVRVFYSPLKSDGREVWLGQ